MDWIQFLILFLTMIGVFLTLRSDSRRFENKMDKYDKELKEFRERWAEESKDFHGRLIAIEERRNKLIFKE